MSMTTTNAKQMKLEEIKKGQVVRLNADAKTLSTNFKSGEEFKVLGIFNGCLVRLSRTSDHAKLITEASRLTLGNVWDVAHTDDSGASREITIATVLAGEHSGRVVMHMTPKEEAEYNRGMAEMATWG
jgi:hypothetical protein